MKLLDKTRGLYTRRPCGINRLSYKPAKDGTAREHIDRTEDKLTDKNRGDEFGKAHLGRPGDITHDVSRHQRKECPKSDERQSPRVLEEAPDAFNFCGMFAFEILGKAERLRKEIDEARRDQDTGE